MSALSKSLTKLGVITNVGVRPTAVPSDLIKLLDHPKAGDVVLEMLVELVINRGSTAKTYGERWSSNSSRLPFVDAAFVGALLCDYERKSSTLAASCLNDQIPQERISGAQKLGQVAQLASTCTFRL
jgi:hypothetical protein